MTTERPTASSFASLGTTKNPASGGSQHLAVQLLQPDRPCRFVLDAGGGIGEARVAQAEAGASAFGLELDRDNGFRAARAVGTGQPRHLDEPIAFQAEKPPVVRMSRRRLAG